MRKKLKTWQRVYNFNEVVFIFISVKLHHSFLKDNIYKQSARLANYRWVENLG